MPTDYTANIRAGIAWLDANITDWRTLVDPDTLDLGDESYCLLGQVEGNFFEAKDRYGLSLEQCRALGFECQRVYPDAEGVTNYLQEQAILTEQWREALSA